MSSYDKINNSYETDTNSSSNGSASDAKLNQFTKNVEYKYSRITSRANLDRKMQESSRNKPDRRSLPSKSDSQQHIANFATVASKPLRTVSMPTVAHTDLQTKTESTEQMVSSSATNVHSVQLSLHKSTREQAFSVTAASSRHAYECYGEAAVVTSCSNMDGLPDHSNSSKDNPDILQTSDCSEQSDDNVSENIGTIEKVLITTSVSENSCNAVDMNIATTVSSRIKCDLDDLSFNGKITGVFQNSQENVNCVVNVVEIKTESTEVNKIKAKPEVNLGIYQMNMSREEINERSPDIFLDDDDDDDTQENSATAYDNNAADLHNTSLQEDKECGVPIEKAEKALARKLQNQLASGIVPPPSVTYIEHDILSMLNLYNTNKDEYAYDANRSIGSDHLYSAKVTKMASDTEVMDLSFDKAVTMKNMGLLYNRTEFTDNIEIMYMKLSQRYVGRETDSTFVRWIPQQSAVRKTMAQSPGNRLSHLARRRAVFSSANLSSNMQLSLPSKLGRKPCVIDASKLMKKEKSRTPKRRTPSRKKLVGRQTPTSSRKRYGSATKAAVHILPKPVTATRESSKRALFQSPAQEKPKVNFTPDVAVRVEKSKRALMFSPPKPVSHLPSQSSAFLSRTASDACVKRRRDDDENFSPRASKIAKSQSMCGGSLVHSQSQNVTLLKSISESSMSASMSQQLSGSHKQKLLWAVSTALKKKSVTSSHENFKIFASTLAKIVKRLYTDGSISDTEKQGGTSATMLRLADKLVFFVIQGKSVDDIYMAEKTRIDMSRNVSKLTGYIGAEEYANRKNELSRSQSHDPSENNCPSAERLRQRNDSVTKTNKADGNTSTNNLTNSSSKNNLSNSVLRENHDSKSAQKNAGFSGRDQKNVSPYSDKVRTASSKSNKLLIGGASNSNVLKVRRQISFDA